MEYAYFPNAVSVVSRTDSLTNRLVDVGSHASYSHGDGSFIVPEDGYPNDDIRGFLQSFLE
jgi:hypothetical protein